MACFSWESGPRDRERADDTSNEIFIFLIGLLFHDGEASLFQRFGGASFMAKFAFARVVGPLLASQNVGNLGTRACHFGLRVFLLFCIPVQCDGPIQMGASQRGGPGGQGGPRGAQGRTGGRLRDLALRAK